MAAHALLKTEFTKGNKCHNLMSRLIKESDANITLLSYYIKIFVNKYPVGKTSGR